MSFFIPANAKSLGLFFLQVISWIRKKHSYNKLPTISFLHGHRMQEWMIKIPSRLTSKSLLSRKNWDIV
jgi:hypothetical protein